MEEIREGAAILFELVVHLKAAHLFGRWLRRPRVTGVDQLDAFETAEASGSLTPKELRRCTRSIS